MGGILTREAECRGNACTHRRAKSCADGSTVVPTRLLERGFTFELPDFESAARKALEACGLLDRSPA
jgi:NAD dependent epimerase/dehydratase family enzyme